ncbi:MAG: hypothetical protein ABW152_17470 [Candidatus Thiodiazotropha endolucinida]
MKKAIVKRKQAYQIEMRWLELFASTVKESTGKYTVGHFKWENYLTGLQTAVIGNKAYEYYHAQDREDYYLFNESVSEIWDCTDETFPDTAPDPGDWYVFPKSGRWTMVFSHDDVVFFARNEA